MNFNVADRKMFEFYFEDLCKGARQMAVKTGEHGSSGETTMNVMMKIAGQHNGFLLIATDDDEKFMGFVLAVFVETWVDMIAMYLPNAMAKHKHEAFKYLCEWARAIGADKILAGVTRSPETFFKWFYEPLGFNKVGIIIEHQLKGE